HTGDQRLVNPHLHRAPQAGANRSGSGRDEPADDSPSSGSRGPPTTVAIRRTRSRSAYSALLLRPSRPVSGIAFQDHAHGPGPGGVEAPLLSVRPMPQRA